MDVNNIDSRELDPGFKFEIAAEQGGEGILHCYACGACTVRCPEQKVKPEYNPREIIRKALLGLTDEVFRSEFIWICSAHYLCLSRCPQDVNIKAVMNAVRNLKIEEETRGMATVAEVAASSTIHKELKYRIVEQDCGKDIYHCFACGVCTANCPERSLDDDFSPRIVIRKILVGLKDEVFQNEFVDICSMHFRCLNECPQSVEIPKLMTAIRRLAEKYGYTRDGKRTEHAVESEEELRKKMKKGKVSRVFIK